MGTATVGFDIEFFTAQKDGLIVPVCGLVGGNKHEHRKLGNYEVHEDNVALEVNSPVFTQVKECLGWLSGLKSGLNIVLDKANIPLHIAQTRHQHVIKFPKTDLAKAGPQALEIGCDPDFSAYVKDFKAPRELKLGSFHEGNRYVGGHIHLGYSTHKDISPHYIARILHLISIWAGVQSSGERLTLYGNGLFRPKPYGIEYRSLGTGSLLTEQGLSFVACAFILARKLEESPQEIAELYSTFSEQEWRNISSGKSSNKIGTLIGKTLAVGIEKIRDLDSLYDEPYVDFPPGEQESQKVKSYRTLFTDIQGFEPIRITPRPPRG